MLGLESAPISADMDQSTATRHERNLSYDRYILMRAGLTSRLLSFLHDLNGSILRFDTCQESRSLEVCSESNVDT